MQSSQRVISVSKRKLACRSCRRRKKACNAGHPSCALCIKLKIRCEYSAPNISPPMHPIFDESFSSVVNIYTPNTSYTENQVESEHPLRSEEMQWVRPAENANARSDHRSSSSADPDIPNASTYNSSASDLDLTLSIPASLPSDPVLLELVEIFFARFYDSLPCFHKSSFIQQVRDRRLQIESPLLLYTICAITAKYHPDPAIQSLENDWYQQSRLHYELTQRAPEPILRSLQAALCLVYYSCVLADFAAGWLFLGKAWRQACALGLNRLDSDRRDTLALRSFPRLLVEREELRRTLWRLFMLDQGTTWTTGWAPAMDDRHFKVNLPIDEGAFQTVSLDAIETEQSIPFSRDLGLLISAMRNTQPDVFRSVCIAHVILARIVERMHSLHDSPNSPDEKQESDRLDAYLVKFRLSLPQSAASVLSASRQDRELVVWLNMLMYLMTILLNYRPTKSTTQDNGDPPPMEKTDHFAHVVIAARNIVQLIRDTSLISVDLLVNPNFGSVIYLAGSILITEWRSTKDMNLKDDIDMIYLLFDRYQEQFPRLGMKYKGSLDIDLQRPLEVVSKLREEGFRGLWDSTILSCTRLGLPWC